MRFDCIRDEANTSGVCVCVCLIRKGWGPDAVENAGECQSESLDKMTRS